MVVTKFEDGKVAIYEIINSSYYTEQSTETN